MIACPVRLGIAVKVMGHLSRQFVVLVRTGLKSIRSLADFVLLVLILVKLEPPISLNVCLVLLGKSVGQVRCLTYPLALRVRLGTYVVMVLIDRGSSHTNVLRASTLRSKLGPNYSLNPFVNLDFTVKEAHLHHFLRELNARWGTIVPNPLLQRRVLR